VIPTWSDDGDRVLQSANTGDRYSHRVSCFERERIGRDHTGAGQEDSAVRELLRTKQIFNQLAERSFDLSGSGIADKHHVPSTPDLEANAPLTHLVFTRPNDNPRTNGARGRIDLGLRQIQQVLSFDVA